MARGGDLRDGKRVGIVDGCRTPFTKMGGPLAKLSGLDLSIHVVKEAAYRAGLEPGEVDTLVMGAATPDLGTPYLARETAIALGWMDTNAYSVESACATGARTLITAAYELREGERDIAIAGGVESMSNVPVLAGDKLAAAMRARGKGVTPIDVLLQMEVGDLLPKEAAVAEPYTGKSLGEHAEEIVRDWSVTREESDQLALASHRNAAAAADAGYLAQEIVPVITPDGERVATDGFIRWDTTEEKVAKLKPVFDADGTVTAANVSPLTDGASALVAMPEDVLQRRGVQPKVWIRSWAFTSHAPKLGVLLGPSYALPLAMDRAGVTLDDLGLVDLHEAFAGQVVANLKAMADDEFARSTLGRERAIGTIDRSILNVNGGSVALGHPFGATGGRIILQLANEMVRRGVRYGATAICAGGTRGAALVLELAA